MAKAREVTKGEEDYIKENLWYDPETGYLWWSIRGVGRQFDKPLGHVDKDGYICVFINKFGKPWQPKAHRLAWFLYYGAWPENQIDHTNGIKNDNRISNLRQATSAENNVNKSKQKLYKGQPCSSQYKGVYWDRGGKKWRVGIRVNRRLILLGYLDNEEEAALAYNKAALEYFGEFAKINIIEPLDTGITNTYISSSSGELTC
jgi:hypothetical protein